MPTLVFNYKKDKVDKLDELAKNESRTRSSYIQKVLFDFLKSKGINSEKKKKVKIKKN